MATFICRSAMFPIQVKQMKNVANMQVGDIPKEFMKACFEIRPLAQYSTHPCGLRCTLLFGRKFHAMNLLK